MAYDYKTERNSLFSDAGQRTFLKVRDRVQTLLAASGAVRMQEAMDGSAGDSWTLIACVDRMVELGELREISQPNCAGQHRVFVSA